MSRGFLFRAIIEFPVHPEGNQYGHLPPMAVANLEGWLALAEMLHEDMDSLRQVVTVEVEPLIGEDEEDEEEYASRRDWQPEPPREPTAEERAAAKRRELAFPDSPWTELKGRTGRLRDRAVVHRLQQPELEEWDIASDGCMTLCQRMIRPEAIGQHDGPFPCLHCEAIASGDTRTRVRRALPHGHPQA